MCFVYIGNDKKLKPRTKKKYILPYFIINKNVCNIIGSFLWPLGHAFSSFSCIGSKSFEFEIVAEHSDEYWYFTVIRTILYNIGVVI